MPRRKTEADPPPPRYISMRVEDGVYRWRVIGPCRTTIGPRGEPECSDVDLKEAVRIFQQGHPTPINRLDIPIFNAEDRDFSILSACTPCPYPVGTRVRAYRIGHNDRIPGVVVRHDIGGAFLSLDDMSGERFFLTPSIMGL